VQNSNTKTSVTTSGVCGNCESISVLLDAVGDKIDQSDKPLHCQRTTDAPGMWLYSPREASAVFYCMVHVSFCASFWCQHLSYSVAVTRQFDWLLNCPFARIDCILWWNMSMEVIWCFASSKKENSKNQWQCEFISYICQPVCGLDSAVGLPGVCVCVCLLSVEENDL